MMKNLEKTIRGALKQELDYAIKDHGEKFNSTHEAYAVIKEEYEEAQIELEKAGDYLNDFWDSVKHDANGESELALMFNACVRTACEAIQTAAMCLKARECPLNESEE